MEEKIKIMLKENSIKNDAILNINKYKDKSEIIKKRYEDIKRNCSKYKELLKVYLGNNNYFI